MSTTHEKWSSKIEFVLSVVGYAVGLGNIWRFPYKAYSNGGGAFLLPYFLFLFVNGIPLFSLEFAIGQFSSNRPINSFAMVSIFRGVGYGMCVISANVALYSNMIISYAIIYFYYSLVLHLPWKTCDNLWNTINCTDRTTISTVNIESLGLKNLSLMNKNFICDNESTKAFLIKNNVSLKNLQNFWNHFNCSIYRPISPAEEFWKFNILQKSDTFENTGHLVPSLVGASAVGWICVFLCLVKGIKSSGKVVYFTATVPYLILTILLIRGALLENSYAGIMYYITPTWSELKKGTVWIGAAYQIFASLGIGFGSLVFYASYNDFNNNFNRDAILCAIINCCTSLYAGFAVFAVVGHLSYKTGLSVDRVILDHSGLIFIVFPEVLSTLPAARLWSALTFFMIIMVGLDSQFGMFDTAISIIFDNFPLLKKWRITTTLILSIAGFLLGLPLATQAGSYWVILLTDTSCGLSLILLAIFEVVSVSWIYGIKNFSKDYEMMTGGKPNYYWLFSWTVTCPVALIIIFIYSVATFEEFSISGVAVPLFAQVLGWGIFLSSVMCIPIYAVYRIVDDVIIKKKTLISLFQPDHEYGPKFDQDRDGKRYKYTSTISTDL